ncbi:hypothetical protein B0T24DRAFT_157710 [Lasiosphaeria ovina]|uniref:Uncharacterized protein n=1 Tax=Lasiosphaeria ovina TaxID=92902 RepID=A0AAE0NDL2_9PEZI|nr:hypothetical protein B0T24DRAFT_157710 [Lasiosphaeria ovina]
MMGPPLGRSRNRGATRWSEATTALLVGSSSRPRQPGVAQFSLTGLARPLMHPQANPFTYCLSWHRALGPRPTALGNHISDLAQIALDWQYKGQRIYEQIFSKASPLSAPLTTGQRVGQSDNLQSMRNGLGHQPTQHTEQPTIGCSNRSYKTALTCGLEIRRHLVTGNVQSIRPGNKIDTDTYVCASWRAKAHAHAHAKLPRPRPRNDR